MKDSGEKMKKSVTGYWVVGIGLCVMQLLAIVVGEQRSNNPWNSPSFLQGDAWRIVLQLVGLATSLFLGIVGLILIIMALRVSHKNKKK